MSAIKSIPEHYTTEFETNWVHKAQQLESRFKEFVNIKEFTGERMRCSLIDESGEPQEITERAGATKHTDLGTENRWIYTRGYEDAKLIDEWDEDLLGTVSAPNGDVLKSMFSSFARHCDERVIEALGGAAYIGKDGTATQAFSNDQIVAVDYKAQANTNLTLDKLIETKSLFGRNEVAGQSMTGMMDEPIVMAVSQSQLDGLLRTLEVTSVDYNSVRALVSGEVDTFLGIRFIRSQLLPLTSDVRDCFAWVPTGLKFSQGDHRVDMDVRADRSHALQIRVRCRNGGVRMEEKKVVKVLCDETA